MTASFLSPAVDIVETDNTLGVASVGTSTGGMVISASWGPVNTPVLCAHESDLVNYFGKPNDENFKSWLTAANFLSYTASAYIVRASAKGLATAVAGDGEGFVIENDDDYDDKIENVSASEREAYGSFVARCPGKLGNSLFVTFADSANFGLDESGADKWFYDDPVLGRVEFSKFFSYAPNTSRYVGERGGSNDEIHVLVVDMGGEFTGTRGTILEKYEFLSKAKDSCALDGDSNFVKNVINAQSKYVYFGADPLNTCPDFGAKAKDHEFADMGSCYFARLRGGQDDFVLTMGNVMSSYDILDNQEAYDISLFMTGAFRPEIGAYVVQNICEVRKDAIAFVSPCEFEGNVDDESNAESVRIRGDRSDDELVKNCKTAQQRIRERTVAFRKNSAMNISSSYGVLDSGWKYQYDKYNDCYRWIPLNGDVAGLYARTSDDAAPWWSAAGYTRGQIKNCVKLSYSPSKADRDILYPLNINPVVTFAGEGTVLFGDKTLLQKTSAFQQVGVRRLFIYCEKILSTAAKYLLFELNDDITRATAKSLCETPLRVVQGSRGIINFKVVCDTTNNTADIINANRLVVDLYIQPNRSINYVTLNFIAEAAGSSVFTESEG